MKKMKGFQTFIAIALAVMMVLPCVSALAEEAEVSITVSPKKPEGS